ncbi:hypothetical protein AMK16_24075 [Streptomyces sp. CB00455]|uniref:hypothetical protein n=1 Tax=Streptomyces sp. CB00455 TaxID=1703927 RepID=UPI00093B1F0E|nr:hypothetical protein [Streptomyces sp. CB00455]OKK16787.1 hypothetical protein AMK16_24075 [Streptomyces sp. CB00455]
MHVTKPSRARRARLLVPAALAVVILSGAAAPAGAVEGDSGAALTKRTAAVRQQLDKIEKRAAAGPVDDLLAGLTKTLQDLLKSLEGLLPAGVKLPPIELPKLPALPDLTVPEVKLPAVEVPALPAAPVVLTPEIPAIPEIPEIPDLP